MISISSSSKIFPTNNFGRHNNVYFVHYGRYVNQGNNWANYGLHQVQIRNDMLDKNLEVIGWEMKDGRVEEDFRTNIVKPGLFYTARLVPYTWGRYHAIQGALIVRVQGTNTYFTLGFEDPFHDNINGGYKGSLVEGNDPERAILDLREHNDKERPWGSYHFDEFNGRGRTCFTITDPRR